MGALVRVSSPTKKMANEDQEATGAAPLVGSADPLDFSAFIVYVKKRGTSTPQNDKARALCADFQELVLQEVESIAAADRPPWLAGVPTIVDVKSMKVTAGTAAVRVLEAWTSSRPRPVGSDGPGVAGVVGVPVADSFSLPLAEGSSSPVSRFSSVEDLLRRRAEGPGGPPQG